MLILEERQASAMISKKRLDEIKEKIVKAVSPEKIILFGSYATAEATEDSDVDLLVIWNTNLNPHQRNLFLSRLFHEEILLWTFLLLLKKKWKG